MRSKRLGLVPGERRLEALFEAGSPGVEIAPSAQEGERRIAQGDLVLVDFGYAPAKGELGVWFDGHTLVIARRQEEEGPPWLGRIRWRLG